jgi:MFS family permease
MPFTSTDRSEIRRPAVLFQAAAGLAAQLTQGAAGVGIVLVVRQHTGSVALAGLVVGVLSLAVGAARPLQGRLMDARGGAGVMAVCGIAHPTALAGIVGLAVLHAPGATLVALGAIAGLALPPVSSAMRVAWGERAGAEDRTAAYSLVYMTQTLAVLFGPLILAVLVAAASAAFALVAVAGCSAAGTLAFAASMTRDGAGTPAVHADRKGVLRARGMHALLALAMLVGAVIGALEVATPVFATTHRSPAAAGLLFALLSVGGIAGAAVYGRHRWQVTPNRRLLPLLAGLAVFVSLTIAAGRPVLLGALLLMAGVPLNPVLTTLSLLVDQYAPPHATAEAFGWLSTGIAGGTGAAGALAGALAQHEHSARPAFAVAAGASLAAVALAAVARRTLGPEPAGRPE